MKLIFVKFAPRLSEAHALYKKWTPTGLIRSLLNRPRSCFWSVFGLLKAFVALPFKHISLMPALLTSHAACDLRLRLLYSKLALLLSGAVYDGGFGCFSLSFWAHQLDARFARSPCCVRFRVWPPWFGLSAIRPEALSWFLAILRAI